MNKCTVCEQDVVPGYKLCREHKCYIADCPNNQYSRLNYCQQCALCKCNYDGCMIPPVLIHGQIRDDHDKHFIITLPNDYYCHSTFCRANMVPGFDKCAYHMGEDYDPQLQKTYLRHMFQSYSNDADNITFTFSCLKHRRCKFSFDWFQQQRCIQFIPEGEYSKSLCAQHQCPRVGCKCSIYCSHNLTTGYLFVIPKDIIYLIWLHAPTNCDCLHLHQLY